MCVTKITFNMSYTLLQYCYINAHLLFIAAAMVIQRTACSFRCVTRAESAAMQVLFYSIRLSNPCSNPQWQARLFHSQLSCF